MKIFQVTISLRAFPRGFHLITDKIESDIRALIKLKIGVAHIFIQHTSASLTLNENWDPTVRQDFESHFSHMVPENAAYSKHIYEGLDDLPAHLKASILGSSILVPITNGRFSLGTWQGIYLCEHRNRASRRKLIITIWGE